MGKVKYLPMLYKRTATGKVQEWAIGVEGTTIVTRYGQVGGKIQTTKDSVRSGKNQGRKNATEAEEQAYKEAYAQWTKKKKAGYLESSFAAERGEVDSIIEGGIVPMLAKVFEDYQDKIEYPVMIQPKLDGHRCIAMIDENNKVTLWTRTRKPITSVPHIQEMIYHLSKKLHLQGVVLDGELYNHSYKNDFEKLTSAIRKKEPSPESTEVEYHIYDMAIDKLGFRDRHIALLPIEEISKGAIQLVDTKIAKDESDIMKAHEEFRNLGYEGVMVRTINTGYEFKRSSQLLKLKVFQDEEFEVIGVEEGRGKLQGHAGAFVCKDRKGKEFRAKMSGETSKLKEYWKSRGTYIGQMLTVKYQGKTSDGIPRFPVGIRIREDL